MSHDFFLPVSAMTESQRARRERLTEVMIDIVSEVGPENFQMKDVAERSHVALGTAYRYFASKEHLMAEAWAAWHRRFSEKIAARGGVPSQAAAGEDVGDRIVAFVHREMRAFQRNPNFARLVVLLEACSDPYVAETLEQIGVENERVMLGLMDGVPHETAQTAYLAISSCLHSSITYWTTGRKTMSQAMRDLENVTRLVMRGTG